MRALLVIVALLTSSRVFAVEYITGQVTIVEPSYLPTSVYLQMSTGSTLCPAGRWLVWSKPDASSNRAIFAGLLSALSTGKRINFVVNDGDASCTGQFIHFLKD